MGFFIFILQTLSSTSFFEPLKSFFQSKRIPAGCVTQLRVFCDDSSLTKSFQITTQQKKQKRKKERKIVSKVAIEYRHHLAKIGSKSFLFWIDPASAMKIDHEKGRSC